jgi:hypothetical protein
MLKHINNYTVEYWAVDGTLSFWAHEIVDQSPVGPTYLTPAGTLSVDYKEGLGFSGYVHMNGNITLRGGSYGLQFGGMKDFEEWIGVVRELYALAEQELDMLTPGGA